MLKALDRTRSYFSINWSVMCFFFLTEASLRLLAPSRLDLLTDLSTHPSAQQMNPGSPRVSQKCHCVVSPGLFFSARQCDFYIRCHGDVAKREENGALTSGFSRLPGQTPHLGEREQETGRFVCTQTMTALEKVKLRHCGRVKCYVQYQTILF